MCASNRAEASTGESLRTSAGAPHGRMAAERSTPPWHSQLLADEIKRPGTRAPCQRANSPDHQIRLLAPRQARGFGRQFVGAGKVEAGRQQRARGRFARPLQLFDGKIQHRRLRTPRRLRVGYGAVGRPQVNAHQVFHRIMKEEGE